jgi:hypothetical protein
MKLARCLLLLFVVADTPTRLEPAIPYFTNLRQVQIAEPDRQNFFVVDQEVWENSRPDLADLRLYDGESPIQFAISEQRAGVSSDEVETRVLNLGSVAGHTEFDLDAESLTEYDRIRLRLDARDFVATASVSGGSAPGKGAAVELTTATLYDFSKEQLGSNFQLKLPTSSFRYLHLKLSPGIPPEQVKSATLYNLHEQQASWTKVGSCSRPQNQPHLTVISCNLPEKVPLSRILFDVDPAQVNFRRTVSLEDAKGRQLASGEISRVRINRAGTLVTNEELWVNASGNWDGITIKVDNGDNPPLAVTALEPLAVERRVYFDPQGNTTLTLYYGDSKLSAPIYDYARFFHADASPAQAQLATAAHNPQYVGRPDQRPWSDRHTGILWTAMIAAVLTLTVLALRGLRTQSAP